MADQQSRPAGAKINLLYVASSGRSGSTLLELLIGAHRRIWTLGEFRVLPFAVQSGTKPCGCGTTVKDCPFWGPILEQTAPVALGRSISRFRDGYDVGRLFHLHELPFFWSRKDGGHKRRGELQQFGSDNASVLDSVLRRAREVKGPEVTWLVDASKNLYRLLWLKQSDCFNLRVIHLVKDPRAFAYSISKRDDGSVNHRGLARATFRWNAENYLFEQLFKNCFADGEVLRIKYEDLAGDTEAVLGKICSWLGLAYDENMVGEFRNTNHG